MDGAEHEGRRRRLQAALLEDIPLTGAIGLRAAAYEPGYLALAAPLLPNVNHKETAFAGSLNAAATLACWGLLWCLLDERGARGKIVIQDSSVQYLRPVEGDFVAASRLPGDDAVERFLATLARRSRARIELAAEVWQGGRLAVSFSGRYVVQAAPRG